MGRGTPGYSTAHLRPLGQKPTGALPASSGAATHAHITIQASSVGQHSTVQEPQPEQRITLSGEEPKWPTSECRTPSTRTNGWFTSTTSSAALPPAEHAPPAANPSGPSRATNSPGTSPTLSTPKPPAPPNRPSTWRPKRWSHRASTTSGGTTAPTQYGYAVNADTRQARCPSKVNTSSPKPNGNRRATRAATS